MRAWLETAALLLPQFRRFEPGSHRAQRQRPVSGAAQPRAAIGPDAGRVAPQFGGGSVQISLLMSVEEFVEPRAQALFLRSKRGPLELLHEILLGFRQPRMRPRQHLLQHPPPLHAGAVLLEGFELAGEAELEREGPDNAGEETVHRAEPEAVHRVDDLPKQIG